ncbi:hypothetical protein [Pseudomonas oryzicola]|uniref:Uncharacterized protein n=1 Tax=Pseudomonas oryzicola TaxID=485876 RepID=A0ABS6QCA6_9PSED|nr:hypothetical protein [Pseudomonas oryzicola]MBV4491598.1 hypothetical protein [Pseudomonas oryzicola]
MLVKIQDMDESTVEMLKAITGKRTGSGAVEAAAIDYIAQCDTIKRLREQEASLTARLEAAERTIQRARAAASELLERTGQLI